MPDDKLLSQADIDALVSSTPRPAPAVAARPAPPVPAQTTVPDKISSLSSSGPGPPCRAGAGGSEIEILRSSVAELAARLETLGKTMSRLEKMDNRIGVIDNFLKQLPQKLQPMASKVSEVETQVEQISDKLVNTPGYGGRKTFQCGQCKTKGMIAVHVRCTQCGKDTLLGWWPTK